MRSLAVLEAVLIERERTCSSCGTREDEWGTLNADGVLQPAPNPPYVARTHLCLGCEAKAKRYGDGLAPGVTVELRRHRA